ncbi:MAG: carbohydrate kinase family protein [Chitinophagaceae bacterium]|nr:carbohydrate kinase family protein [Chitinophagaceae bacterium]
MRRLQPIYPSGFLFDHIIATGGIGSGMFFSLSDDHTLGRNESRMATLLPYKDFCKQHIIMHYISVLLGAGEQGGFQSYPIGKVGDDEIGRSLIEKIKKAGMNSSAVSVAPGAATLFSVCFQYPDKTGGNITTENSASNKVSPEDIDAFFTTVHPVKNKEIILAVPEVPLAARVRLLEYGRQRGSLNVSSVLSSEIDSFKEQKGFHLTDILFVNIDEAEHIANSTQKDIVNNCINTLKNLNPSISIIITDGPNGSYTWTDNHLSHTPAIKVHAISTAGAGDAFLAGTLTGLCCGLPLDKSVNIGTLLAAWSVTSADTIHPDTNAQTLFNFIQNHAPGAAREFAGLFKNITAI